MPRGDQQLLEETIETLRRAYDLIDTYRKVCPPGWVIPAEKELKRVGDVVVRVMNLNERVKETE